MAETDSKFASLQEDSDDSDGETFKKEYHPMPRHPDIPLPPKGFIPLKASEEERLFYGFPARPNPATHPKQYELWERTLGLPLEIQPHVPRKPVELPVELQILGKASGGVPKCMPQSLPSSPSNFFWGSAASVYQRIPGCTNVTATWRVPQVKPPVSPEDNGPWGISCMVQLDDMLLAGTTSYVSNRDGEIKTGAYAFATFISSNIEFTKYQFPNIDVTPGDLVTCSVCAPFSDRYGTCLFNNQTTGKATSLLVTQPFLGDLLTRTSAAWGVVEGEEDEDFAFSQQPPYIGVISLFDCSGSSPKSSLGLNPGEVVSNLDAPEGSTGPNPIWETAVLTPSVMWVLDRT